MRLILEVLCDYFGKLAFHLTINHCIIDVIHIVEPRKIIQDLIHSLIIPVFRDHTKTVMICI